MSCVQHSLLPTTPMSLPNLLSLPPPPSGQGQENHRRGALAEDLGRRDSGCWLLGDGQMAGTEGQEHAADSSRHAFACPALFTQPPCLSLLCKGITTMRAFILFLVFPFSVPLTSCLSLYTFSSSISTWHSLAFPLPTLWWSLHLCFSVPVFCYCSTSCPCCVVISCGTFVLFDSDGLCLCSSSSGFNFDTSSLSPAFLKHTLLPACLLPFSSYTHLPHLLCATHVSHVLCAAACHCAGLR